MSAPNDQIIEEGLETPIETAAEVIAPVVVEPKRYEYQPTDEDGRPVGGKQVIKYTTQDELVFKLQEQNTQLIRKLRQQTRDNRLGISTPEVIDDSAQRFKGPVEFKPRQLSKEDRAKLSRDLLDEDTFDQAAVAIFEASTGINSDELRSTLTSIQQDNMNLKATLEAEKFKSKNPDFIGIPENIQSITNWMLRYDLAPVEANFQKAFDTLKASDLLVTSIEVVPTPTYIAPVSNTPYEEVVSEEVVREEIPVENQIPIETVIQPVAEVKPVVSRVPTSLNKGNSGTAGASLPIGDEIIYEYVQVDGQGRQVGQKKVFKGLAAINAMPSEEYKKRMLSDKGFTKKVEKLEAEAAKRRRG